VRPPFHQHCRQTLLPSTRSFFHARTIQELGLEEVIDLSDDARQDPAFSRQTPQQRGSADVHLGRDGCRVPMPWNTSGSSLGFGPDGGSSAWLPQPRHWARLSVAAQETTDDSMLARVRHAISVRRASLPLLDGAFSWADDLELSAAAADDSVASVFPPLALAAAVGTALTGAAAAAWRGLKGLVPPLADPDVLTFERRHATGCVVCVFNMGDSDVPLPPGQVQL
jgi:glycosidase